MELIWAPEDRDAWQAVHAEALGPLQQSWRYGSALNHLGVEVIRCAIAEQGQWRGLAQFSLRRVAGLLTIALASRGPLWLADTNDEIKSAAIKRMRRELGSNSGPRPMRGMRLLFVAPDEPPGPAVGRHCIGARLSRPLVTGISVARLNIDLEPEQLRAAMHGKWRNRLVAAEKSELRVRTMGNKAKQYQWLLDADDRQQHSRGYRNLPRDFVAAWQEAEPDAQRGLLILRADQGRDAVAAMMFLLHGRTASYHIGWADQRGRDSAAHNLLLWNALLELRKNGITQLNLGSIDTQRGAGIARFKIGAGARVESYCGTFLL